MVAPGQNEQSAPNNFSYTLHLAHCPNRYIPHTSDNNKGWYSFMPPILFVYTRISNLSTNLYAMRLSMTLAFAWTVSQSNRDCLLSTKVSRRGLFSTNFEYIQNYVLISLSISQEGSKIMELTNEHLISKWMHFSTNLSKMKIICLVGQTCPLANFSNTTWMERHELKS